MMTLPTLLALSLASPAMAQANDTIIDPIIQAVPATEMVVTAPALPSAAEIAPEVLAEAVVVEPLAATPIDWGADGGDSIATSLVPDQQSKGDMGLVLFPLAAALFAGAWFFKKKVFSAVAANKGEDPIHVVSRKTIAGQASVVLVDVTAADGTTRRLLLGSGDNGVNLVADISPMDSLFPESPEMTDSYIEPQVAPELPSRPAAAQHTPATVAQFSNRIMDDGQVNMMKSNDKNDLAEMPRFRKRRSATPPVLADDIGSTTPNEKRMAAQAVLDEVLAERKNSQNRGSRIRVTA